MLLFGAFAPRLYSALAASGTAGSTWDGSIGAPFRPAGLAGATPTIFAGCATKLAGLATIFGPPNLNWGPQFELGSPISNRVVRVLLSKRNHRETG